MKIEYRIRVRGGWGGFAEEPRTPAQVADEIKALRVKCAGKSAFKVTKPGDKVPTSYSGNCSELDEVHLLLEGQTQ